MKTIRIILFVVAIAQAGPILCQEQPTRIVDLQVDPVAVSATTERIQGAEAIRVVKSTEVKDFDEPTFARLKGISFNNGIIEVKVLSRLLKDAPDFARGFIGVAFRINDDNSKFECIYLRPTNGRAEDQLRRNRAIQYFSFPGHKFERLRKEEPGVYEAYADMGLDEWIEMRIEVKDSQARMARA